jgi:hypothetical protein
MHFWVTGLLLLLPLSLLLLLPVTTSFRSSDASVLYFSLHHVML